MYTAFYIPKTSCYDLLWYGCNGIEMINYDIYYSAVCKCKECFSSGVIRI